jgi:hypothetical protein
LKENNLFKNGKRKKYFIASMALVFTFSVYIANGSLSRGTVNAEDKAAEKRAIEFRKEYGMDISNGHINKILSEKIDTEFEKMIGTPLTDEELAIYEDRVAVKKEVLLVREVLKQDTENYGDIYYSPEDGTLVVQVKSDDLAVKEKVKKNTSMVDRIRFEIVKYSTKDFEDAEAAITALAGEAVKAIIPDVMNNKLIVILNNEDVNAVDRVKKIIKDSNILEINGSAMIKVNLTFE